jgi:nitroreductase
MDALELLTTRSSTPRLQYPAPTAEHWHLIQKAAVRVPDHAGLRPWSFIVFDNEQRQKKLGELYAQAAKLADDEVDEAVVTKAKTLPFRAPLVIACVAKYVDHPKVPRVEQVTSAGCAVMAMQQAAFALGYGGVWRTGAYAHNPHMKTLLGLDAQDEIVGYLYLGTALTETIIKPEKPIEPHFVAFEG